MVIKSKPVVLGIVLLLIFISLDYSRIIEPPEDIDLQEFVTREQVKDKGVINRTSVELPFIRNEVDGRISDLVMRYLRLDGTSDTYKTIDFTKYNRYSLLLYVEADGYVDLKVELISYLYQISNYAVTDTYHTVDYDYKPSQEVAQLHFEIPIVRKGGVLSDYLNQFNVEIDLDIVNGDMKNVTFSTWGEYVYYSREIPELTQMQNITDFDLGINEFPLPPVQATKHTKLFEISYEASFQLIDLFKIDESLQGVPDLGSSPIKKVTIQFSYELTDPQGADISIHAFGYKRELQLETLIGYCEATFEVSNGSYSNLSAFYLDEPLTIVVEGEIAAEFSLLSMILAYRTASNPIENLSLQLSEQIAMVMLAVELFILSISIHFRRREIKEFGSRFFDL